MGKKTLYDEMKAGVANVPRRPKEFEGNRANPSIVRARLKEIARDPEAGDDEFLTNRFSGFRNKRGLVKSSVGPVRRWLEAQHHRPWDDIRRELRQELQGIPKALLKDFMPSVFDGAKVGFWSSWVIGELDAEGIFHSRNRSSGPIGRTIREYRKLDRSKLPHLAEGWYIGAVGEHLYWFRRVEKTFLEPRYDLDVTWIKTHLAFPQGPKLTPEEAAHFRSLEPWVQERLMNRELAIYDHRTKQAA